VPLPLIAAAYGLKVLKGVAGQIWGEKRAPGVYNYRFTRSPKSASLAGAQFYGLHDYAIREDGSGTYGMTANVAIDWPPAIARYILTELCGVTSGYQTTGASTFGSFTQAITDLNAKVSGDWQVHFGIYGPEPVSSILARLCQQAPMNIWKSQWTGKWCCQVYKSTPDTWDYFLDPYSNAYSISYDTDLLSEPEIGTTDVAESVSEVHVRYRKFAPTDAFTRDTWVGPAGSDDGTGTRDQNAAAPDNREALLSDAKTQFGIKNAITLECDQLYLDSTAVAMRNYVANRFYRPRVTVDLTVWARFAGIEPGQIIKISDDWLDHVGPPPKYPYGTTARKWSDLKFFVAAAPRLRMQGGRPVIDLSLEEVI